MNTKHHFMVWAGVLCVGTVVATLTAAPKSSSKSSTAQVPKHVQAAMQLVADVKLEDTNYEHGPGRILWRGVGVANSECHTDCSGLMNHLFEFAYGIKDSERRTWLGTGRPTAKTYHDAIAQQNRFLRITNVALIHPGDILAAKYASGENTGHVMLAIGVPLPRKVTEPLVPDTKQWELAIIDSSMSGHGKTDTRALPGGKYANGLGRGVLRLYSDAQGNLAGYTWSPATGSEFHSQAERHMEIGRLVAK
jgi:hypothetical protein